MTAAVLRLCPKCKTENLERIIGSGGGMIFKGSGFYQTDYKKTSSKSSESKPKTPSSLDKKGASEKKDSAEKKPDSPPKPSAPKE